MHLAYRSEKCQPVLAQNSHQPNVFFLFLQNQKILTLTHEKKIQLNAYVFQFYHFTFNLDQVFQRYEQTNVQRQNCYQNKNERYPQVLVSPYEQPNYYRYIVYYKRNQQFPVEYVETFEKTLFAACSSKQVYERVDEPKKLLNDHLK